MNEKDILTMIKLVHTLSQAQKQIKELIRSDDSLNKGVPYAYVECETALSKAMQTIRSEAIDAFNQALNS